MIQLLIVAQTIGVLVSAAPAAPLEAADKASATPWKSDVSLLVDHIIHKHAAPFRTLDAKQWAIEADNLQAKLGQLSPESAIWEFRRLVAKLDDSHTFFRVPRSVVPAEWFPLLMGVFSDGLFVKTGHIAYREVFGKRITHIEGVPVAELFSRMRPFISADNDWAAIDQFKSLLREPSLLRHIDANRPPFDEVELTYSTASGQSKNITLRANTDSWVTDEWRDTDDKSIPQPYWRDLDPNFGFRFLQDEKVLHFVCNKIRDEPDETVEAFFQRMFAAAEDAMKRQKLERMIIDIRNNGGGNGYLWAPLPRWILRQPKINRPGGLFVIISRDTFSAGCLLAYDLERWTNAVFIGEPTPHRPNFNGDTEPLTLPASGIRLRVSELLWQQSDPRDTRKWLTPDVVVVPSSRDFINQKDRMLETALAFVPAKTTPEEPSLKWSRAIDRNAEAAAPDVIRMLDASLPHETYISHWPAKKTSDQ